MSAWRCGAKCVINLLNKSAEWVSSVLLFAKYFCSISFEKLLDFLLSLLPIRNFIIIFRVWIFFFHFSHERTFVSVRNVYVYFSGEKYFVFIRVDLGIKEKLNAFFDSCFVLAVMMIGSVWCGWWAYCIFERLCYNNFLQSVRLRFESTSCHLPLKRLKF